MKTEERNPNNRNSAGRLAFLDWTRGLAVLIMLQGHVFHSFSRNDQRNDGPYLLSQFLGGIGPAVFLFLTGITLAFLIERRERQGMTPSQRWGAALRRSLYLFMLAFLFRSQLWLFGYPWSDWHYLFKVDILNCMGFAIGLLSISALFSTATRVRIGAVAGVIIAALGPVVSSMDWRWMPAQVSDYFVPSYDHFAFFPWAAFIAFGLSAGSILRLASGEQINRIMQWATLMGIGLIIAGQYFSNAGWSLYPKAEFWLNSPGLVTIKLGVIMIGIAMAFLWNEYGLQGRWSMVRQMGTTSLIVYWTHIELVYGRWFSFFKESLTAVQCVACSIVLMALMLGLSRLRTNWPETMHLFRVRFPRFAPYAERLEPQRASGD